MKNKRRVVTPSRKMTGPQSIPQRQRGEAFDAPKPPPRRVIDKDDFYSQLKEFDGLDLTSKWTDVEIKNDRYLIEVFTYKHTDKTKSEEDSTILAVDKDGEVGRARDIWNNTIFTHVAKVIKVGDGLNAGSRESKYKAGDIILLNKAEVCGEAPNPTFIQALQYSKGFGGEAPVLPDGTKRVVKAIQARFQEFYITLPEDFETPVHSVFNFAIPETKITGKYNLQ